MKNVHKTVGHIRAFKGMRNGKIVKSSLGPADHLVWAGPPSMGGSEISYQGCRALRENHLEDNASSFLESAPFARHAAHAATGANTRLVGTYRRKRGRELRYTYSGSYGVNSEGGWWQVVVRCNRRLRGVPSGVLKGITSPDGAVIRGLVERSIEDLVQMEE